MSHPVRPAYRGGQQKELETAGERRSSYADRRYIAQEPPADQRLSEFKIGLAHVIGIFDVQIYAIEIMFGYIFVTFLS